MNVLSLPEFQNLLARIASARARWRAIDAVRGFTAFLASFATLLLFALLLDRWLHGGSFVLLVTDAAFLLLTAFFFWWKLVRPLRQPLRDEKIAVHIEHQLGNLEGRLINTIQIARDEHLASNPFTPTLITQNCRNIQDKDFLSSFPWRATHPSVFVCLAALGLLALYGYLSPDRFTNSLQRYLFPTKAIEAITSTQISSVEPGNLTVLGGTDVTVRALISGDPSSRLSLRVGSRGNWRELSSLKVDQEGRFEWIIPHITRALDYQVLAGDDRSEIYHIQLTESPTVQSLDVTLIYPEYTGRPQEVLLNHSGNLELLEGTTVRIRGHANKRLQSAEIHRSRHGQTSLAIETGKESDSLTAEMTVTENEAYWFTLVDKTGNPSVAPVQHTLVVTKDLLPTVQILSPATEEIKLTPADQATLMFAASDDFGLKEARLILEITRALDQSLSDLPGQSLTLEKSPAKHSGEFALKLGDHKVADGDHIRYFIEVADTLGQRGVSATRSIAIVTPSQESRTGSTLQLSDIEQLKKLLARQQANLTATEAVTDRIGNAPINQDLDGVTAEQMAIQQDANRIGLKMSEKLAAVKTGLLHLAREEMADALAALDDAGKATQLTGQRRYLLEATLLEEEIIKKLERLVSQSSSAAEAAEKARQNPEVGKIDTDKLKDDSKALDAFKEKLTHFYKEQKANVIETQKLLEMPPDSPEAQAQARKVLERQRLAEKLAREAKDQTKVLAEEKITNEHLIALMEDVYRAVSDAVKAGERKETRNMLLKEEMAVLMADSIPNNGEAFLTSSAGSKTKWDYEDWPEEERPETKLPPIPPDMHDTLGDLLDAQEDLAEDADDMNSQMHFGATDNTGLIGGDGGPASNWMAKGRSGNTKPKNNEVGGRSGSGRTGKTSGEFVDAADVAKEGRETEDRYTKEQALEGFVPTKGDKKRSGGSTSSGGKRSDEATEFGLRGDAPINWSKQRMKLSEKQDELKLKMELFSNRLKAITGAPDFDANAVLLLMQEVESDLSGGRFEHAVRKQVEAVLHLKKLRRRLAAYAGQTEESTEQDKSQGTTQRDDPLHEKFPDEYRKLLQEYYKALSETTGQ